MSYNYPGELNSEQGRCRYLFNKFVSGGLPRSSAVGVIANCHRTTNGVTYPFFEWNIDTGHTASGGIRGSLASVGINVAKRYNVGGNAVAIIQEADGYARRSGIEILSSAAQKYMHEKMAGKPYPIPPDVQCKDILDDCRKDPRLFQGLPPKEADNAFRKINNPGLDLSLNKRWEKHGSEILQMLGLSEADLQGSGTIGNMGSAEMKTFNIQEFEIKEDESGQYTEEPFLLGIANHIHFSGGTGTALNGTMDPGGEFPAGQLPIPAGFYPDKVLWYFLSHAEGDVAVMWTTGKDSRTPVASEGCDGYDYPGGVHSKSLLPPGWTIARLGVSWTDNGRKTLGAEGKYSGARWGWKSTKITPEHEWWKALMPIYRDAMIWAWNNVQGLHDVKDPADRLCEMHMCNWGYHHNTKMKGTSAMGYPARHKVAVTACEGMQRFP